MWTVISKAGAIGLVSIITTVFMLLLAAIFAEIIVLLHVFIIIAPGLYALVCSFVVERKFVKYTNKEISV